MAHGSFYPTYFSIEDIMITQEKVPCKTNMKFPRLGFLSPDNDEEDLPKDVSLNVPMWLAQKLIQNRTKFITVELPHAFKEKTRDALEAGPTVINLFRLNPNFYEFGLSFTTLQHRDCDIIKHLLFQVFRERFKLIFDWAIHRLDDPTKTQNLCLQELKLLKAGREKSEAMQLWFIEEQLKMKPAEMVVSLKKRKLLESK